MNATIIALINIGLTMLIVELSIPLILRKVPMNDFYGVRFRQSFKSEKNWYEINEHGAKILLLWTTPILLIGIYRFIGSAFPPHFSLINAGLLVFCVLAATPQSYLKARQIDKQNG